MGRIVELSPNVSFEDVMATKGQGYKPDFRIFTAGIESDRKNDRLVHMVGSSTEKDLQGDTMSILALQSMTKAAPNLTVWLNHNYDLPDSIFGSIIQTPSIMHREGLADLHLDVDVELENPAAARVKRYIDNGRRLGCSIGCMVTKYEVPEDDNGVDTWGMQPITIHEVYVVEYSVVGIPANQRSWVENAIRGVYTRTLDESLAPAMKSLWPNVYKESLKSVDSAKRKRLEDTPARPRMDKRLDWYADTKTFVFSDHGKEHQISREAVKHLIEGNLVVDPMPVSKHPVEELDADLVKDLQIEDAQVTQKDSIPNQVNPYGPSDSDGYDTDGDIDGAPTNSNSNGPWDDEKTLMLHTDGLNHDAFNGQHTHEHDSFGHDGAPTHKHLHTHLHDNNHNHDHEIVAANEGKSIMPEKTAGQEPEVRRAINKDGSEGLTLKASGDHEPYKGLHTHHHDSFGHGDVEAHSHEHFHGDDNDHKHDHSHTPMGENADSYYSTEPDKKAEAAPVEEKQAEPTLDAHKQALLASYNGIGKLLELPEVTESEVLQGKPVPEAAEEDMFTKHFTKLYTLLDTRATPVQSNDQLTVLNSISEKMALFAKSLDGLGDVLELKKDAEATRATVALAKKELDAIFGEVQKASKTLDALKNMPIGNPTHQHRNVTAADNTVTHDELLGIKDSQKAAEPVAHDSLTQALALTEVKSVDMQNGQLMRYRYWPEGVGGDVVKGVRPPLTGNQISFMEWNDVVSYREGKSAHVPYLDNQVDSTTK